jgi:hypothetical protein
VEDCPSIVTLLGHEIQVARGKGEHRCSVRKLRSRAGFHSLISLIPCFRWVEWRAEIFKFTNRGCQLVENCRSSDYPLLLPPCKRTAASRWFDSQHGCAVHPFFAMIASDSTSFKIHWRNFLWFGSIMSILCLLAMNFREISTRNSAKSQNKQISLTLVITRIKFSTDTSRGGCSLRRCHWLAGA